MKDCRPRAAHGMSETGGASAPQGRGVKPLRQGEGRNVGTGVDPNLSDRVNPSTRAAQWVYPWDSTSALDTETTAVIEDTFLRLKRERSLILVTHDPRQAARLGDHQLRL